MSKILKVSKNLPTGIKENDLSIKDMSSSSIVEQFWKSIEGTKQKLTQLQRYEAKNSPESIKKFIEIGGGPKMGTTLEKFARFQFKILNKRKKGKGETGYDQIINNNNKEVMVEQKSSGHWGDDDYKWQHVEEKHKWELLLLCGIDFTEVKFWLMDRKTFKLLVANGKISNQGNKEGNSTEGVWFNYSDVKDFITEVKTDQDIINFLNKENLNNL